MASETRKRIEIFTIDTFGSKDPKPRLKWSDKLLQYYTINAKDIRNSIRDLAGQINRDKSELQDANWNNALNKLANTNINTASSQFWRQITRLGGLGRSSGFATPLTYKGKVATSPQQIANLTAEYSADSFQPLNDITFDYRSIMRTSTELRHMTELLNGPPPKARRYVCPEGEPEDLGQYSGTHKDRDLVTEQRAFPPKITNHQRKHMTNIESTEYRREKIPLPPANSPNLKVDPAWDEMTFHNDTVGRKLFKDATAPFTRLELKAVLYTVKRKAPGKDGLFIDSFKHMGRCSQTLLLDLLNDIFKTGIFPAGWKEAILAPLLKKDKIASDPASYRPISLLPVGGKILECLVLKRLNTYLEHRKLIPCFQTGFRKGYSTSINLKRLFNAIYTQSTRSTHNRPTVAIMFDAKKAFDSVWHEGLIHKCFKDGLPLLLIRFLHGWIKDRSLKVRIGDTLSESVNTDSGVPQGSVLSPVIWNYWMGDCPTNLQVQCCMSLYADDVNLWATSTSVNNSILDIQQEIWNLTDWTKKKRIKFEPSKTEALACHKKAGPREAMRRHVLYLDRNKTEAIQWKRHAKLLGVFFSDTGTFHHHFKKAIAKCLARIKALWRFAKHVPGDTLYRVYKTAIEPILLYGTEALFEVFSPNLLKKLIAVEFTAIKICFGLPRHTSNGDCLRYMGEESIVSRLEKRRLNFVANNAFSPLIRYSESLKTNEGRRLRTKRKFIGAGDPSEPPWKRRLYEHKETIFFSDITSVSLLPEPVLFFREGVNATRDPAESENEEGLERWRNEVAARIAKKWGSLAPEGVRRRPWDPG